MDNYNNCSTEVNNILFNVPLNSTETYDLSTNTYNISLKLNDNNEDSTNCLGDSDNIFSLYGKENSTSPYSTSPYSTSPYSIYKNMNENEKNPDNLKDLFDEFIQYDTSKKLVSRSKVKKSKK